ncbi:MAG: NAD(P)-dependent oxidoreductase [Actinomycetota bacterium]|nr:NAD(P)-dependent oxidoreductase [Actinomycetota bacterium]
MRVSVLGMGSMGHALAERLSAGGHQLTVWNRSPGKAGDLVAAGATEAGTPDEAVAAGDAIVISLSDDAAVGAVLLPDGAARAAVTSQLVVDCTTVSPSTTRALADAYADHFVAAPIFGGPGAVAAGQAVYCLGGPADAISRLDPLWSTLGGNRLPCGEDPVAATTVKVVNNSLLLSGLMALAEAVATAQAAGLDDAFLIDLFASSALVAPGLHNRLEDMVHGDHDGWFAMPLGAKDLDLFVSLASAAGLDVAGARTARDQYRRATDAGLANADVAGVVELVRQGRSSSG